MKDSATTNKALDVSLNSTAFERLIEAVFLSELQQEMWFSRNTVIDILHSTVDAFGYDLVLIHKNTARYVQLKTREIDASTRDWSISRNLENLPGSCVIIIFYKVNQAEQRLELVEFQWLGGNTNDPLPWLGDRSAKHARANAEGVKGERRAHAKVGLAKFEKITTIETLADRLFDHIKEGGQQSESMFSGAPLAVSQ